MKFSPELTEETFKFAATMMNDENLLYHNADEACEYLDISKKDLNKLCKEEKIAYVKIGKVRLFMQKDLDEYLVQSYYERNNLYEDSNDKCKKCSGCCG